jgi:hypothetical protein
MTARAKDSTVAMRCPSPLVLFGIDNRGKPKGARFGKEHASLAMKAATQLQLKVLASNDPKVAEIAARLPVGRVHATGRTFVPFIRRDLYDKLLAAAANANAHPTSPPSSGASGRVATTGVIAQAAAELAGDRARRSGPLSRMSGGRLVRGNRRRSCWRHVHVALARLPAATPVCVPSAAARLALSGTQTERRDQQIGESFRPGKARQNSRDRSGCQRPGAAQRLGRD